MDGGRALDVSHYHYLSGWVAVLQGDLLRARECVEAAFPIQSGVPFPLALNHLALAQVLHESGEDAAAAEHLEGARRIGRAMGSRLLEYMCALVEARGAETTKDSRRWPGRWRWVATGAT
ncbi:MAG TPA: hypothetical protein VGW35_01260 [Methylomirabilota bacterium]|jgi:hypothetical protein|nr:hypothetical protein [Methylomirabilota bacterium]